MARVDRLLAVALSFMFAGGVACKSNRPPDVPAVPAGPVYCFKDTVCAFKTVVADPEGNRVAARFDWGDSAVSDWTKLTPSGATISLTHRWRDTGDYAITVQAEDEWAQQSGWSGALAVRVVLRLPPNAPQAVSGPSRGGQDTSYEFASSAAHPDSIPVAIRFAWGDGDTSDWSAFVCAGESVGMSHTWTAPDTYYVTAQARDTGTGFSLWTAPHTITIKARDTLRKWRVRLADSAAWSSYSSPAIGPDGRIYVGLDSALHAVDPDGSPVWSFPTGGHVEASPAIAPANIVYFAAGHSVYALTSAGKPVWTYTTGGIVKSTPAIGADGTIYVGSNDNRLYAFDLDGDVKWSYVTSGDVTSSPAVAADGTVYFGSLDEHLYALNSDGTLRWRYDAGERIDRASPCIGADGTVYCGSDMDDWSRSLFALNPDSSLKWSCDVGGDIRSSPVLAGDGTVYVGAGHGLNAVDPDGTVRWNCPTSGTVRFSSPTVAADGTVYVGTSDNCLYAIDADGTLRWRYETGGNIYACPAVGADGTIYFASSDGYLYALNGTSPLANSPWPKFHHDPRNTGRTDQGSWSRLRMVGQPTLAPDSSGFLIHMINEGTVEDTVTWLAFHQTPDSAYMRNFFIGTDHCQYPLIDGMPGTGPGDTIHLTAPMTIAPNETIDAAFFSFYNTECYPPGHPVNLHGRQFVFRFSDGSEIAVNP